MQELQTDLDESGTPSVRGLVQCRLRGSYLAGQGGQETGPGATQTQGGYQAQVAVDERGPGGCKRVGEAS